LCFLMNTLYSVILTYQDLFEHFLWINMYISIQFLSIINNFWEYLWTQISEFLFFNWSMVNLQHCVSFKYIAKWLSENNPFQIIFHYTLSQNIEYNLLFYMVGPFWLSIIYMVVCLLGFPGGSEGKESAFNVGDLGSIPGLGRSPREGNGHPFQYSSLENSINREAWQATVHRAAKSSVC